MEYNSSIFLQFLSAKSDFTMKIRSTIPVLDAISILRLAALEVLRDSLQIKNKKTKSKWELYMIWPKNLWKVCKQRSNTHTSVSAGSFNGTFSSSVGYPNNSGVKSLSSTSELHSPSVLWLGLLLFTLSELKTSSSSSLWSSEKKKIKIKK